MVIIFSYSKFTEHVPRHALIEDIQIDERKGPPNPPRDEKETQAPQKVGGALNIKKKYRLTVVRTFLLSDAGVRVNTYRKA